jgi:AraC-like DNA-binding protein
VRISAGDLILLPHGSAHRLCDDPQTPSVSVSDLAADIPPGGEMSLPFGADGPEVEVICCAYDIAHTATPTLRGLPTLVHLPADKAEGSALPGLLASLQNESTAISPGAALIRSRLIDLVFVYALRLWLEDGQGRSASWIDAVADPSIGPVLQAVHENPGRDWTIASLAELARQSRAVFCKKFSAAVGEPPMNYVAKLRMAEAARQLAEGARMPDVAAAVGYSNEFAFAKALKRARGVSPGRVRRGG